MELLKEEKRNVRHAAAVSSVLVLTTGALLGNLSVEDSVTEKSSEIMQKVYVQQNHNQMENLLQVEQGENLLMLEPITTEQITEEYGRLDRGMSDVIIPETVVLKTTGAETVAKETIMPETVPMETEVAELFVPEMEEVEEQPVVSEIQEEREVVQDGPFLLDAEGMLYDVNEDQLDIQWGYLEIPENCTGIRSGALAKCADQVEEIFLPVSVTVIEPNAFAGLSALGWIETAEENACYCSYEGVLFTKDMTTLMAFPQNVIGAYSLPNTVKTIEEGAFDNTNLTTIDSRMCGIVDENVINEIEAYGITII